MGHTIALCTQHIEGGMPEALHHAAQCAACRTIAQQDAEAVDGPAPGTLATRREDAEHARERLASYVEHLSNVRSSGRQVGLLATAIAACERALWAETHGRVGQQFSNVTGVLVRQEPVGGMKARGLRAERAAEREAPTADVLNRQGRQGPG